jgi:hypothetical protein
MTPGKREDSRICEDFNDSFSRRHCLQPAIPGVVAGILGKENVTCVDRDEDNRDRVKYVVCL